MPHSVLNLEGDNPHLATHQEQQCDQEKQHWIKRPCLWVAYGIKWLPVIFITACISWSYYAFMFALCIPHVESVAEKTVLIIFYHIILILFASSYWKTIFSPTFSTPARWHLSTAMVEKLNKAKSEQDWKNLLEIFVVEMEIPVVQRSVQGAIRYCEKCKAVKPDRSHHCSVCGKCILKMDHHCPWVNNCVAFSNYKFFMLFLGYALIYCVYLVGCVAKYFVWFWTGRLEEMGIVGSDRFHILFLFFVAIMFFISVSSLFWYHVFLVCQNRTTLEQFRAPVFANGTTDERGWSLGKFNNFQEVFGSNIWTWFMPVHTAIGDGLTFPTNLSTHEVERGPSYQSFNMRTVGTLEENNDASPYQNGDARRTEVFIDSNERISVKVKESKD